MQDVLTNLFHSINSLHNIKKETTI